MGTMPEVTRRGKQVGFSNKKSKVSMLEEIYPEVPWRPKPILTRRGMWLEAAEYEHIDTINKVLLIFHSEDALLNHTAKTVAYYLNSPYIFVQHINSENSTESLSESFEIIESTVEQLNHDLQMQ